MASLIYVSVHLCPAQPSSQPAASAIPLSHYALKRVAFTGGRDSGGGKAELAEAARAAGAK